MKMDNYSREAFSDEQVFIALASEAINGSKTGASEPGSAVFLFKNCKHRCNGIFILLLLFDVIK